MAKTYAEKTAAVAAPPTGSFQSDITTPPSFHSPASTPPPAVSVGLLRDDPFWDDMMTSIQDRRRALDAQYDAPE